MKHIKYIASALMLFLFLGCSDDDFSTEFINDAAEPSNLSIAFGIEQDNSGLVTMVPSADGATRFIIAFGDGTEQTVELGLGESAERVYPEGTYEVGITAIGLNGKTTESTQTLVVSFRAPENLQITTEIDTSNPFLVNVSATADFAASFLVFFDASNPDEEPTPLSLDGMVSFEYPMVGDFEIRVVALSGGAETSELTQTVSIQAPTELPIDFEIFDATVFQGFGGASNAVIDNPDTNGNASATVGQIVKGPPEIWAGNVITLSSPIDFSSQNQITMDVWSPRPNGKLLVKLENIDDGNIFVEKEVTLNGNSAWEQVSVDFSDIDLSNTYQKIVLFFDFGTVGDGSADWTFFIDNIDQALPAGPSTELITNGDFEAGSASWLIGVDDNSMAPVTTENGNTFYSVDVTSANPTQPFLVNVSQKLEIIQDETYVLTFDAWSNVERSIIAGIGLSGGNFANNSQPVNINTEVNRYALVLTAGGFGAPDARVLFDLAAEIGTVNIDNVSLKLLDNLVVNSDFEAGSASWLIGVDDSSMAPVVTENGNTFYSVDVTDANPSQPFLVNVSQKLEIIEGERYVLSFEAWSNVSRSIIAGIGLSGGNFANNSVPVDITPTVTRYNLVLTANGFGAPDARILFDLAAEVGTVNIDNVTLSLD